MKLLPVLRRALLSLVFVGAAGWLPQAQAETPAIEDAIEGAQRFLLGAQDADGHWGSTSFAAHTCTVVSALVETASRGTTLAVSSTNLVNVGTALNKGVNWILANAVQSNGGIYKQSGDSNYENGLCLFALVLYANTMNSTELYEAVGQTLGCASEPTDAAKATCAGTKYAAVIAKGRDYYTNQLTGGSATTFDTTRFPWSGLDSHQRQGWDYSTAGDDTSVIQYAILGIRYANAYLGDSYPAITVGQENWLSRIFWELKTNVETGNDGGFSYSTTSSSSVLSMTGAGLWSVYLLRDAIPGTASNEAKDRKLMQDGAIDWIAKGYSGWGANDGANGSFLGWNTCPDRGGNSYPTRSYYYCIFSTAKAMAAVLQDKDLVDSSGQSPVSYDWNGDLAKRMAMLACPGTAFTVGETTYQPYRWAHGCGGIQGWSLSGDSPEMWTAFVLSSLSFADPSVAKTETFPQDLPEPEGDVTEPDPVNVVPAIALGDPATDEDDEEIEFIEGEVTLRTIGNTLISALPGEQAGETKPFRERVREKQNPRKIKLPAGALNFRLTGLDDEGYGTLKLVFDSDPLATSACDPEEPFSFVKADTSAETGEVNLVLRDDIGWFKLTNAEWQAAAFGNTVKPDVIVEINPNDEVRYDKGSKKVKACSITVRILDNGAVDNNDAVGVIDDPGALGFGGAGADEGVSLGAGGGGCSVGTTRDYGVALLLALSLLGLGWRRARVRRR